MSEKYKKEQPTSYAVGTQATIELLKRRPKQAIRLFINPAQRHDETYDKLLSLAKLDGIPVIENNQKIFKEISGKDNTMSLGEFRKEEQDLDPKANHVVLVNPSNPGNLGTIIRAMAAFSYLDLAIITPSADPFDPKCVRATMGALFSVRVHRYASFEEYRSSFGEKRSYYPFMLQAKTTLKEAHHSSPFTLIFGNEATGLDRSFLDLGEPLLIPHTDLVDSLNLDNAVSIALYEFLP